MDEGLSVHINRIMDGFTETYMTIFVAVLISSGIDILTGIVMILAGFFWLITLRRVIQEKHRNSLWHAVSSLFRKRNKYGR